MATLTVPAANDDVWGRLRVRIASFAFDSSYPTGGEAITAAQFGFSQIVLVVVSERPTGATGKRIVQFDPAASKLVVLQGDNDGVADGAFVEFPDTTSLSSLVVDLLVIGH